MGAKLQFSCCRPAYAREPPGRKGRGAADHTDPGKTGLPTDTDAGNAVRVVDFNAVSRPPYNRHPTSAPAAVAYITGSGGTLIGADIVNIGRVRELGAGVASIGGAGTFDGVFSSGIVAVVLVGIT